MTRKQAILKAIEVLSDNKDNKEIIEKLESIHKDLPMTHWNVETIFDAFDQYILEYKKLPSFNVLKRTPTLPSHSTIKNRFGLSVIEFYNTFYKDLMEVRQITQYIHDNKYWIERFKEQYKRLNYPNINDFDKVKDSDTPTIRHLIKLCGVSSWNELLTVCGFKLIGQNKYSTHKPTREHSNFTTHISTCEIITTKKLDNANINLKNIVHKLENNNVKNR